MNGRVALCLTWFVSVILLNACDQPAEKKLHEFNPPVANDSSDTITTDTLDGISLELDDETVLRIDQSELPSFSASIRIEIDDSEIPGAGDDILIDVNPSIINSPQDIELRLTTSWQAPSFSSTQTGGEGRFRISFIDDGTSEILKQIDVPLEVTPVWEIQILGPNGDFIEYSSPESFTIPVCLRPHPSGVSLRFVNYDTSPRRIHGDNPIEHQSGSMAASPGMGQAGGSYTTIVTTSNSLIGLYYIHNSESEARGRRVRFNASENQLLNPADCLAP